MLVDSISSLLIELKEVAIKNQEGVFGDEFLDMASKVDKAIEK